MNNIIIDCIADLHGHYPKLEGGDLLIVAGDLTAKHIINEFINAFMWISQQSYRKKVLIAGNHDTEMASRFIKFDPNFGIDYLCDSGTEFEGLKIWGSPWTQWFKGVNPRCTAFMLKTEEELAEKWALIPDDIDILVTHSPPNGILDAVDYLHCGSVSLRNETLNGSKFKNKKLHVFGHIHEWGGGEVDLWPCKYVNASIVNERYKPVNKPVRVIL